MLSRPIEIIIVALVFTIASCETKTDPDFGKPLADSGSAVSKADAGNDAKADSSAPPTGGGGGASGIESGMGGGGSSGIGGSSETGGTSGSGGTVEPRACTDHEDCDGAACDLEAGACVACVRVGESNIGCVAPERLCKLGASAADNRCVECEKDTDCSEQSPVCDMGSNSCVRGAPAPCENDGDCEQGVCDGESHECVSCVYEDDESRGCVLQDLKHCLTDDSDALKNACVQCLVNKHCEEAKLSACGEESHECEKCRYDSDCKEIIDRQVCDASQGCVECKETGKDCPETRPICDEKVCRGCKSHSDCTYAGGICEITTGRCYLRDEVIYVNNETCDSVGDGSADDPWCELQPAFSVLTENRKTIRVEGTAGPIVVDNAGEVLLVGIGRPVIGGNRDVSDSAISVTGDTQLTVEGVKIDVSRLGLGVECDGNSEEKPRLVIRNSYISNNTAGGIKSTDCVVTLEGNEIMSNAGGGVSASGSTVTLEGNEITSNTGGGVSFASCGFTVTNNVITGNGQGVPSGTTYGGVRISQPGASSAVFHSNTVAFNIAGADVVAGVRCEDPVDIVSSIVYGNSFNELSGFCVPNYSLIGDGSGNQSETKDNNLTGDPSFISETNLSLKTEEPDKSPCIDAGDPESKIKRDIEGNVRPQGKHSDMGAYEVM